MLQIRLDRVPFGINERKTVNPTMGLVETAIRNAGFSDGVWILRSPHRTRKKGAERFRTLRSDGSGIRVRCKPGGNDTCYEWTLVVPEGMDQDLAFDELCFLHANTLMPTKSLSSLRRDIAVVGGLVNAVSPEPKPEILPPRGRKASDVANMLCPSPKTQNADMGVAEVERKEEQGARPARSDLDSKQSKMAEHDSLLDRALTVVHEVADGAGFAKRAELSDSLIGRLSLDEFISESEVYESKQAAMRALMMALCGRGYLDRVMYGKKSTNGYRLTDSGRARLAELGVALAEEEFRKELESVGGEQKEDEIVKPKKDAKSPMTMVAIKELVAEHESLDAKIEELRELLAVLGTEREDRDLIVSGLNSALGEKRSERSRLDAEISRMEEKLSKCEEAAQKAANDAGQLEEEMAAMVARREELEKRLTAGS